VKFELQSLKLWKPHQLVVYVGSRTEASETTPVVYVGSRTEAPETTSVVYVGSRTEAPETTPVVYVGSRTEAPETTPVVYVGSRTAGGILNKKYSNITLHFSILFLCINLSR
jgi:hypothetical protein